MPLYSTHLHISTCLDVFKVVFQAKAQTFLAYDLQGRHELVTGFERNEENGNLYSSSLVCAIPLRPTYDADVFLSDPPLGKI